VCFVFTYNLLIIKNLNKAGKLIVMFLVRGAVVQKETHRARDKLETPCNGVTAGRGLWALSALSGSMKGRRLDKFTNNNNKKRYWLILNMF
jgi:hypothetical protein